MDTNLHEFTRRRKSQANRRLIRLRVAVWPRTQGEKRRRSQGGRSEKQSAYICVNLRLALSLLSSCQFVSIRGLNFSQLFADLRGRCYEALSRGSQRINLSALPDL